MNTAMLMLAAALNLAPGEFDVVIAPNAPGAVQLAAEEMTNFLSRALGAPVPCRKARELRRTSIVLGTNELSRAAGVDISSLRPDGYLLKTKGNALYIAGHDDHYTLRHVRSSLWFRRGTLNGVYAFLEDFAGCRFYFPGELGEIVPRCGTIAVPELDRRDNPAMEERCYAYHSAGDWFDGTLDPKEIGLLKNRNVLRLRLASRKLISCHGLRSFKYVRRFAKEHPEYFCLQKNGERYLIDTEATPHSKNGKLCFTSGIREEIYQDVKAYLTGKPPESRGLDRWRGTCWDNLYVGVQPEDGYWPCQCAKCQAAYRKGDPSYASELIWGLTKEIADRLKAESVPAVLQQSAYSAWSRVPDFDLPPNISIDVATRGPWATGSDEALEKDLAKLKAWSEKVGHSVLNWTYPGKYGNANTPRNEDVPQVTPHAYAKYYKAVAKYISGPDSGSYAETCTDRWMFDMLNVYVFSRLAWDPSVDVDAVLDEHYRLMYGAAAPQMKKFFEILEMTWMKRIQGKTVDTPIGPVTLTPSEIRIWTDVYSPARLKGLSGLFARAAAAVPPDSLEAKRIAFMKREFLDRMTAHGAKVVEGLSVEKEKARRAANPPKSILPDFKPVTIAVELSMTNKPFYAVKHPVALRPGHSYRLSYFVKGESLAPYAKRGGAQAVVWFNEAEDEGKSAPRIGFDGTFDWIHHSFEFYVPKQRKTEFRPEIDVRVFQATGTAHFDGLILEELK